MKYIQKPGFKPQAPWVGSNKIPSKDGLPHRLPFWATVPQAVTYASQPEGRYGQGPGHWPHWLKQVTLKG